MLEPFVPARVMLAALRDKQISATELLELHLDRIARYNSRLNAIVTFNEAQARQQAARSDEAYARGTSLRPLQGLPLTIKDSIEVAGLRTTSGLPERAETISEQDAPVAQRVQNAGAVLLGKTNVSPGTADWQANNSVFGRTNNPWDLARTPGGSTGGGAAALAAGLTPLEFGSDIGGSIRIPAAFCGVYGHRPSESAVPRQGHVPGTPIPNPGWLLAVQGPLARSAADLEMALDIISGPSSGEDVAWRLVLPPPRQTSLSALRVAIMPRIPWLPVDDEITAAMDDLAIQLSRLGAKVAEVQPEFDVRKHEETYGTLMNVYLFLALPDEVRGKIAQSLQRSPDPLARVQAMGITATAGQLLRLFAQRERYRAAFRDFFRNWDVLLAPVTLTPAFPHVGMDVPFRKRTLQINNESVPYNRLQVYPGIATLSGQPATAFPWGRTKDGLPIGLQAIGPYLEDRTLITFASLLEQEFGGFVPPAGYTE